MSAPRLTSPCRNPETCARGKPLLCCHQLVVGFGGAPLLPPIDFVLYHNELCAVVGRNGAGKTTWFRTLLGLQPPVSGRIETCTRPLPMAYIPQRVQLDELVPLRARDVVALGLLRRLSFLRPLASEERGVVDQALEAMAVTDLGGRRFRELSEGQKQRVLLARLLASRPELAVLDEPTAAMDQVAERDTLELIDRLRRQHELAILIVTHHLPLVSRFADRVIFLDRDSQTVVGGPPAEVFVHPAFRSRYGEVALGPGVQGAPRAAP